jgi:hypothetical protein
VKHDDVCVRKHNAVANRSIAIPLARQIGAGKSLRVAIPEEGMRLERRNLELRRHGIAFSSSCRLGTVVDRHALSASFDQDNFVSLVVVANLVHESANQQQSAPAGALQVGRIGRIAKN